MRIVARATFLLALLACEQQVLRGATAEAPSGDRVGDAPVAGEVQPVREQERAEPVDDVRVELVAAFGFTNELPELVRHAPTSSALPAEPTPTPLERVPPRILFAETDAIWLTGVESADIVVVRNGRLEPYRHRANVSGVSSLTRSPTGEVVLLAWREEQAQRENVLALLDSQGRVRWRRTGPFDQVLEPTALRGSFFSVLVRDGVVHVSGRDASTVACFDLATGVPRPIADTLQWNDRAPFERTERFRNPVRDGSDVLLGVPEADAIVVERWHGGSRVERLRLSPIGSNAWLIATDEGGYVVRELGRRDDGIGRLVRFDRSGRRLGATERPSPEEVSAVEARGYLPFAIVDSTGAVLIPATDPRGFYIVRITSRRLGP